MNTIILDIETQSLPPSELPPFDKDAVKLGNLKDPEKIATKIAEAEKDWMSDAALDPRTGMVLCVGVRRVYADGNLTPHDIIIEGSEAHILDEVWNLIGFETRVVGYNISKFDIPFLVRRSWKLSVETRPVMYNTRYLQDRFIDLRDLWQLGDREANSGGLDGLAKFFGLPQKLGNGAGFANLWHNDRPKAIEYLTRDLDVCEGAARRMGVI